MELPLFDLATIATATNNFSNNKRIGAGGFGSVYKVICIILCISESKNDFKIEIRVENNLHLIHDILQGNLSTGLEVAVKRLSKNSAQGVQEFKNEAVLIAKLQHKNLVRLLGCCVQGEERILLYEYMPNKSLDYFIFGLIFILPSVWISFTFLSPMLCSVMFNSIHTSM